MVPDPQLAAHPLNHPVEVAANCQIRQKYGIFLPHGVPVDSVHVGGVEVIAIDAPGLVEYLRPFRARIDVNLDGVDIDFALARLDLVGQRLDECSPPAQQYMIFLLSAEIS